MKKILIITLSVLFLLQMCLLCSCDFQAQAADSAAPGTDDRPGDEPPADSNMFFIDGKPGEMMPAGDMRTEQPDLTEGKEIIEVYIPSAAITQSIRPLFDYGSGSLRSEKLAGEDPVKTYPVTVEFQGDFVKVNYYVESASGVAQRSLLTGKDNVIIYLK